MTIADIDKRLAYAENFAPCRHPECMECMDEEVFDDYRAALKALRAVLELCDQKCLCGKAGCGNRLFITAPEIRAAINSAQTETSHGQG